MFSTPSGICDIDLNNNTKAPNSSGCRTTSSEVKISDIRSFKFIDQP